MNIVRQDSGNGVTRLVLDGELDLATAGLLREQVDQVVAGGRPRRLVIDLARVSFCDSTGVGALVDAHDTTTRHGIALHTSNPRGMTLRVLQVTGALAALEAAEG